MQTDSELNEAVALKLGWTYHEDLKPVCWQVPEPGKAYLAQLPDYCRDIKAAWEILDAVATKYVWSLHKMAIQWRMDFTPDLGTWKQTVSAEADIAPRAICLAFLKLNDKAL